MLTVNFSPFFPSTKVYHHLPHIFRITTPSKNSIQNVKLQKGVGGEQKSIIEAHILKACPVFRSFSKKLAVSTVKGKSRLKPLRHRITTCKIQNGSFLSNVYSVVIENKNQAQPTNQNDHQPTSTSNIHGAWKACGDVLNIPCNSSYSIQEELEIQPCTRCSWCILQGQPTSHNFHSDQCNSHQLPGSCQMSLHESTSWQTISHLQSQGTLRGGCLCPEQQLDRD